ncbi:MFS transporter [Streptomyces sp. YC504]|uniref:MFS transporter n=1 Tax=Streptomyces mesophilus TaxID=1775132 RepID=A0A6G4XBP9_9ACTN|nr:MFS transporter [Streptomyces mesophilus]NGO74267.1 MFS transporter [Streptomyces mesophilus]
MSGIERFSPRERRVLAVCLAAGFTSLLDQSVLNIAVPALRDSLSADASQLQWIVAGYSLAFGVALVPGGRLGDVHGRKPFFLAGMALFAVAGVLSSCAQDAWLVVAARLVQGLGAGLVNAQVIGTIQDVFTGAARARALGMYAVTAGLATALGPPVGGALIAAAGAEPGWRLAVLLNVPFALATLVAAGRFLPRPRPGNGEAGLDLPGVALFAGLTVLIMLPFIRSTGYLAYGAGAAALATALVLQQRGRARSGRRPLVHPALTRSAPYALGTTVAMTQFGASLAGGMVLAVFLQGELGLSAMTAALVMLPQALGMGATSAFAWRVVRRYGEHRVITSGLALSALALLSGGLATLYVPAGPLPWVLAVCQLCAGAATGFTVAPTQAQVLRHAPAQAAGVAGGLLQMSQRMAAAVCISAVSGLYLHASGPASDLAGMRRAFWHASLACTAIVTIGLLVSVLNRRLSTAPAPPQVPLAPPQGKELTP